MTAWTEGYVADVAYTSGFFSQMMPAHLAFAALCMDKDPGTTGRPERVLELGFGTGFGLVLAAAANPDTYFEGVDFLPQHVVHARNLAGRAALKNISLQEASFQDLAQEACEGQHDVDIITLHGILSWVSEEARQAIIAIAAKRLRPGGLLYVSYNCLPGQAKAIMAQHLLREAARQTGGSIEQQVRAGVELLRGLQAEDARFFKADPGIGAWLDRAAGKDAAYLAHEYLNANWRLFHVSEVAELFDAAKLSYVGSATLAENIDKIAIPSAMQARIAGEVDPIFRETLRDAASNKQFRRDIYARGALTLLPEEREALLSKTDFALAVSRSWTTNKVATNLGEVEINSAQTSAIFDALDDGIADFSSIASAFRGSTAELLDVLQLLIHSGQVHPARSDRDARAAQRLNRVIVEKAVQGRSHDFLASPILGSGIPAARHDLLALSAVLDGLDGEKAIILRVIDALARTGAVWSRDGKPVIDHAELKEVVGSSVKKFLTERLPLWRQLQVL